MATDAEPAANGHQISKLDGKAPESTDYANYFCTYSFLFHQKDMLEDHKRTGAYYNAVMQNRRQFAGKVVLDVGTGSGILAIFAAKAGAAKVYAVEATSMAKHARALVEHNGLSHVVEVIQGTIETVEVPEKVDIIISEWMGYFLLRESMLDSVLVARNRFLKPGGALYPSHARMFFQPMRSNSSHQRTAEFQRSMEGWAEFTQEMRNYYDVSMDCLNDSFREEQKEYYMQTTAWADVHPGQLLGPAACFKEYDLATVTLEELAAPLQESFTMQVMDGGPVEGFVGYFDVHFRGSKENPTDFPVQLSTAPDPTGATHWGQQSFSLWPPVQCAPGDSIVGQISVTRKKNNHRLMEVEVSHQVMTQGSGQKAALRLNKYHIE
ncbi:hypothetical protein WJX72_006017 [[Myrmecia] bisecta]|uniref:Uncharacterized protein n=1 Tax=[Myrmecia] bisecta TaxID=41462 RepID=A0AAW1QF67_9CHLO